eukprot:jgi/Orpsp1_1/1182584/evm.model.c7180000081894.1
MIPLFAPSKAVVLISIYKEWLATYLIYMPLDLTKMKMKKEQSLKCFINPHLRNQISKEYITTMRTYPIQEVNTAIGKPFIPYTNESDQINAYILTKDLRKQVLCGWGDLYLEESENFKSKDYIMNPYGKGKLYKTGYTGKFLPD